MSDFDNHERLTSACVASCPFFFPDCALHARLPPSGCFTGAPALRAAARPIPGAATTVDPRVLRSVRSRVLAKMTWAV